MLLRHIQPYTVRKYNREKYVAEDAREQRGIPEARLLGAADERYRGGPDNPLTDDELEDKVRACCEGLLDRIQDAVDETSLIVSNKRSFSTP